MSTKIGSVVKAVLRDGAETAIVLVLESPNHTSLQKGDRVFVELTNALSGDKVDFFPAPAVPEVEEKDEQDEEESDLDNLTPPMEMGLETVAPTEITVSETNQVIEPPTEIEESQPPSPPEA